MDSAMPVFFNNAMFANSKRCNFLFGVFQFLTVQFFNNVFKKNIAQTMHINDVFAKTVKCERKKTVLRRNKFVFKQGTETKFNYSSLLKYLFY